MNRHPPNLGGMGFQGRGWWRMARPFLTPNMTGRRLHRTMQMSPALPGSLKALLFPPPVNKVQNKGTQGVRARYDAEPPPFFSIVRHPGRPVISVPAIFQSPKKWEATGLGIARQRGKSPKVAGSVQKVCGPREQKVSQKTFAPPKPSFSFALVQPHFAPMQEAFYSLGAPKDLWL